MENKKTKVVHPAVSAFYKKMGRQGGLKSARLRAERLIANAKKVADPTVSEKDKKLK